LLQHFLNPPNWFTAASIFCSTWAVALLTGGGDASGQLLSRACILVVFAGIFDNLDGRVARLTNRYSDFGVQIDSIADILGFGLAPAMLAWTWKLHHLGLPGLIATFIYVVCAAFRLARFNVTTQTRSWPLPGHSQGLTSTMSGGILVTLVWMSNGYLSDVLRVPAWALAGFVIALGYLMVSGIPFRNFKDVKHSAVARRYLALSTACCLMGALAFDVSMWFGVGAALYLLAGLLDGLVVAFRHRMLVAALTLTEGPDVDAADDVEAHR
jgi:CDP-diacylglycerol--serine O-phosphatidyltransferase